MANETKPTKAEKPIVNTEVKQEVKETKAPVATSETKGEESKEVKQEVKETKVEKKPVVKKDEAFARGLNLHISKKHAMYICSFIKGKKIDDAIAQLQEVLKFKRIIPYKGEIPHRHAPGIMAGRYPINASKTFITILKGLKGNVMVNGMDLDKTVITLGNPSWASRPVRRGGVTAKRVNLILRAREVDFSKKKEKAKEAKK